MSFRLNLVQNFLILFCSGWLLYLPSFIRADNNPRALPVLYDADRFFVLPVTSAGDTIKFYTDTGGGLFLYKQAAERFKLPIVNISENPHDIFESVSLPEFVPNASIPNPLADQGRLAVFSPGKGQAPTGMPEFDGLLGQDWFAGRVWTFDYPGQKLLLQDSDSVSAETTGHVTALSFKTDSQGERVLNFPRIRVLIDGKWLDLLFDTGATTHLTQEAADKLKDGLPSQRATSFITARQFEVWRKAHPEWRVVDESEVRTGEPMIEVPEVTIAAYTIWPVWFTRRADKNFHQFMSQFMDKQVEGALGGNALKFFRIRVDYPKGTAVFQK